MCSAFKFPENRALFRGNTLITRKIVHLGLFPPESLYLLATAYFRSVGFVSQPCPTVKPPTCLVRKALPGRRYLSFCDIPPFVGFRLPCARRVPSPSTRAPSRSSFVLNVLPQHRQETPVGYRHALSPPGPCHLLSQRTGSSGHRLRRRREVRPRTGSILDQQSAMLAAFEPAPSQIDYHEGT